MPTEELPAIYQRIAEDLIGDLPEGWETVWVQAEIEDGSGVVNAFALTSADPKPQYVDVPGEVFDDFEEMWNVMRANTPPEEWTTATFILQSDGKLNVEYDYSPRDGTDDERLKAWKAKYLPV
jgi:hypothetical protein